MQQDVLKVLYESLIDPEQRHDLGESIAPFRLLQPALAVVPWDAAAKTLLDAEQPNVLATPTWPDGRRRPKSIGWRTGMGR